MRFLILMLVLMAGCAHVPTQQYDSNGLPVITSLKPGEIPPLPESTKYDQFSYGILALHAPFPKSLTDLMLCAPTFDTTGKLIGMGCSDWGKFLDGLKKVQDAEKAEERKKHLPQAPVGPPAEI